jgi:hypothetical protein
MTPHDYLSHVLATQEMLDSDLRLIQALRNQLAAHLNRHLGAEPRVYYGGSYGKDTMIKDRFDLDLVVYYPHTETRTLAEIFGTVHGALVSGGYVVHPQTVALRLPYESGFHVDVVPGRAQDGTFRYATLYKNTVPPSSLQTSLKVHIDAVRKTELRPLVRLLKIWRLRHDVPLKTFALEIIAARALTGLKKDEYGGALLTILGFVAKQMTHVRLEDPANTANALDISQHERTRAAQAATQSLAARRWEDIVW